MFWKWFDLWMPLRVGVRRTTGCAMPWTSTVLCSGNTADSTWTTPSSPSGKLENSSRRILSGRCGFRSVNYLSSLLQLSVFYDQRAEKNLPSWMVVLKGHSFCWLLKCLLFLTIFVQIKILLIEVMVAYLVIGLLVFIENSIEIVCLNLGCTLSHNDSRQVIHRRSSATKQYNLVKATAVQWLVSCGWEGNCSCSSSSSSSSRSDIYGRHRSVKFLSNKNVSLVRFWTVQ